LSDILTIRTQVESSHAYQGQASPSQQSERLQESLALLKANLSS
jgi:hypothetical protein